MFTMTTDSIWKIEVTAKLTKTKKKKKIAIK